MTDSTTKYADAQGRFPIIQDGTPLTAAQIALLKVALSRRSRATRPDAESGSDPTFKTQFGCDGLLCVCDGSADCTDMFTGGSCGDGMCFDDGQGSFWCVCVQH